MVIIEKVLYDLESEKQGTLTITYNELVSVLGFKDNYTFYDDLDKVEYSWTFIDNNNNQYAIWKYYKRKSYSVYGNKDELNKLFKNQIIWNKF